MSLLSFSRNSPRTAYILSSARKLFVQTHQNTLHNTSTSPILRHHRYAHSTGSRCLTTASTAAQTRKVRVYTKADQTPVEKLASSLASAFEHDPVFNYTHGSDDGDTVSRNKGLVTSMLDLELARPDGETTVHVSDDDSTVAVWHHVNHWKMPFLMQLRYVPRLISALGWDAFRFVNVFGHIEKFHPSEPHMHLLMIGTDAAMRGKGSGSIVISKMLKHCDSHGIPAYLESSSERNLGFYRKHGFEVTQKIPNLPDDCPPVFTMWRDPKAVRDNVQD